MRFKKNSYYIFLFLIISSLSIISFFLLYDTGIVSVLLCFGGFLCFFLVFEIGLQFGLFFDTVQCDESGLKVYTRKKAFVISWPEIKNIRAIVWKTGIIGCIITTNNGEEHKFFPPKPNLFINYLRNGRPDIELKI